MASDRERKFTGKGNTLAQFAGKPKVIQPKLNPKSRWCSVFLMVPMSGLVPLLPDGGDHFSRLQHSPAKQYESQGECCTANIPTVCARAGSLNSWHLSESHRGHGSNSESQRIMQCKVPTPYHILNQACPTYISAISATVAKAVCSLMYPFPVAVAHSVVHRQGNRVFGSRYTIRVL